MKFKVNTLSVAAKSSFIIDTLSSLGTTVSGFVISSVVDSFSMTLLTSLIALDCSFSDTMSPDTLLTIRGGVRIELLELRMSKSADCGGHNKHKIKFSIIYQFSL